MKKGFTLPEAIICVGIVAVIAAIMIPGLIKARPDEEKLMIKKAYNTTSEIVSYFSNDVAVFSRMQADGFADADSYVDLDNVSYSGNTKFCNLFRSKLNLKGNGSVSGGGGKFSCSGSFTSIDGIKWKLKTNPSASTSSFIDSRTDQVDYVIVEFLPPKSASETWRKLYVSRYGRISVPETSAGSKLIDILSDVDVNKN